MNDIVTNDNSQEALLIHLRGKYESSGIAPLTSTNLTSMGARDVFYVRREVDLMKTAKVNAYIMHIFGKIELLSLHATLNYFKIHYFNAF